MILKFDRTSGSVQDLIEVIKCKSVEYELLHKCIIIIIIGERRVSSCSTNRWSGRGRGERGALRAEASLSLWRSLMEVKR